MEPGRQSDGGAGAAGPRASAAAARGGRAPGGKVPAPSARRQEKTREWREREARKEAAKAAAAAERAAQDAQKASTPCSYFAEGRCRSGASCAYSHAVPDPRARVLCKFVLSGACNRAGCPYLHDTVSVHCLYFYANGSCKDGAACRFSHREPSTDALRDASRLALDARAARRLASAAAAAGIPLSASLAPLPVLPDGSVPLEAAFILPVLASAPQPQPQPPLQPPPQPHCIPTANALDPPGYTAPSSLEEDFW